MELRARNRRITAGEKQVVLFNKAAGVQTMKSSRVPVNVFVAIKDEQRCIILTGINSKAGIKQEEQEYQ